MDSYSPMELRRKKLGSTSSVGEVTLVGKSFVGSVSCCSKEEPNDGRKKEVMRTCTKSKKNGRNNLAKRNLSKRRAKVFKGGPRDPLSHCSTVDASVMERPRWLADELGGKHDKTTQSKD